MKHSAVLITGASRGIGAAIANLLRHEGIAVLSPSRTELNLSSHDSVAQYLESSTVPISGLVINAGINNPMTLSELDGHSWSETLQTNTVSSVQILQAIVPAMAERNFGRIVALSSLYANRARVGRVAYSASKAALEAVIRSVALEYAAQNVVANCVAPGFVDTELTSRNNSPERIHQIIAEIPRGRLARAEEVARAVAFLLAPENEYITGQTIVIDGGVSCR
jgi:3-oxoacyl-[acyl-carrier protein] reductase